MIDYLKKHTLYSVYSFIFIILVYGVWIDSGITFIPLLLLFYFSFSTIYFLIRKFNVFKPNWSFLNHKLKIKPKTLFFTSLALITAHFIILKSIPTFEAMKAIDGDTVSLIRMNIAVRNGKLFNYISSFLIHAILPFTILYLYLKNKSTLYYILMIVASFYGFALMQKSFILTLFLPIIIYSILSKRLLNTILTSFIVVLTIVTLTYVANPQLTQEALEIKKQEISEIETENKPTKVKTKSSLIPILKALERRVVLVPGEMVSLWFKYIPKELPHQGINGYGFIAKFRGLNHLDYGKELYPIVHPENKELKGTLNAANFMYEYANFGKLGLILSGITLAILFSFVEELFISNFKIKLALNLYSILILSSSSLTTLMFSGGWGLMILLFITFKNDLNPKLENE